MSGLQVELRHNSSPHLEAHAAVENMVAFPFNLTHKALIGWLVFCANLLSQKENLEQQQEVRLHVVTALC